MQEQLTQIRPSGTKLLIGLFIIAVGILFTADNLGMLRADDYLRYWPGVLIAIGLWHVADPSRRFGGLALTTIGLVLLIFTAGWTRMSIFDLWPLILIGAGVAMIAKAFGYGAGSAGDPQNIIGILSTRKVAPSTPDLRPMRAAAFMGGCEIDLTHAALANGPVVVDAVAVWGGIEITVPPDWDVVGEVVPFMGGFEVAAGGPATSRQQLIVRGLALMGGIAVKRSNA